MSSPLLVLGGHRGMGCTDHDFYQDIRDIKKLPVENTLPSIKSAFAHKATYVEIDAVETKDKHLIVLHNVVPTDHFFGEHVPADLLNKMTLAEIRQFHTGRNETGEVALLSDVLALAAHDSPGTAPWKINIELKHLAGSKQMFADDGFYDNVASVVKASPLHEHDILFSSFGFINIAQMSHRLPNARYGQLCREYKRGDEEQPQAIAIYTDHTDDIRYQYLPFTADMVKAVNTLWDHNAHPDARLGYFNPEIMTVTDPMIATMAQHGFGLNVWALFEKPPAADRLAIYRHVADECSVQDVSLTVITDYLAHMNAHYAQ